MGIDMLKVEEKEKSNSLIKEKYNIALPTQKFILQMCMAQWDGQWFLKSKLKYGIEAANELNQNIAFSFGKIEARHILSALGIRKGTITSIPEVFKIINTFMDVSVPKIMKFKFTAHSNNEGEAYVKKCFIWEEVKKSKKEDEYVCACNFRHRGWMESMGVDGEIIPIKRFSTGDNCCIFKFVLNESKE